MKVLHTSVILLLSQILESRGAHNDVINYTKKGFHQSSKENTINYHYGSQSQQPGDHSHTLSHGSVPAGSYGQSASNPFGPVYNPFQGTGVSGPGYYNPSGGTGSSGPVVYNPTHGSGSSGPVVYNPTHGSGSSGPVVYNPTHGSGPSGPMVYNPTHGSGSSGPVVYNPHQSSSGPVVYNPNQGTDTSGPVVYNPFQGTVTSGPVVYNPFQETGTSGPVVYNPNHGSGSSGPIVYNPNHGSGSSGPVVYNPIHVTTATPTGTAGTTTKYGHVYHPGHLTPTHSASGVYNPGHVTYHHGNNVHTHATHFPSYSGGLLSRLGTSFSSGSFPNFDIGFPSFPSFGSGSSSHGTGFPSYSNSYGTGPSGLGTGYPSGQNSVGSGGYGGHSTNHAHRNILGSKCPYPTDYSATLDLSSNSAGYPMASIAAEVDTKPDLKTCLVLTTVSSAAESPPNDPALNFAKSACPYVPQQLWSFAKFGGRCWVIQNVQENVTFAHCQTRTCQSCKLEEFDYNHQNTCVQNFIYVSVWVYCEKLPSLNQIIRERILVPNYCSCKKILCNSINGFR